MTQDTLTGHSNLVVKYAGRYLTWENGSPILASLAVYRKSLVDHPEYHRIHLDPDVSESLADDASGKPSSRGWGLWWGKKGAGGPADSTVSLPGPDASPLTSPPVSQPSSPRSLPLPTSPVPISPLAVRLSATVKHADRCRAPPPTLKCRRSDTTPRPCG